MSGTINLNQLVQLTQFNLAGSLIFGGLNESGQVQSGPLAQDAAGCFAYASQALDTAHAFCEAAPSRTGLVPVEPDLADPYDLDLHLYIDELPRFVRPDLTGRWVGLGHYRLYPQAYELQHGTRVQIRTEQRTTSGRPTEVAIEHRESGFNVAVIQEESVRFPQSRAASWGMLGVELGSRLFLERLLGAHRIPAAPFASNHDDPEERFGASDVSLLFDLGLRFFRSDPRRWAAGLSFYDHQNARYSLACRNDGSGYLISTSGQRIEFSDYVPQAGPMRVVSEAVIQGPSPNEPQLSLHLARDSISVREHIMAPRQATFSPAMRHLALRTHAEVRRQLAYIDALSREERLASLAAEFGLYRATFHRGGR